MVSGSSWQASSGNGCQGLSALSPACGPTPSSRPRRGGTSRFEGPRLPVVHLAMRSPGTIHLLGRTPMKMIVAVLSVVGLALLGSGCVTGATGDDEQTVSEEQA